MGALDTSIHAQLGQLFRDVAQDRNNRAVIITGSGEAFCAEMEPDESPPMTGDTWSRVMREGRDLLMNLMDIEVPVVGVLNGPASIHAETPILGDIVLAAEDAAVIDAAHVQGGIVPGDGVLTLWLDLFGPNRGRHFLLTGRVLNASELLTAGVVAEVMPRELLVDRAAELAGELAALPLQTARYTRLVLTQRLKRRLLDELGYGLALEGLSIVALSEQ